MWIFPYFQPIFNIKEGLAAGNFTEDEIRRINIALRGTMVVLPVLSDGSDLRSTFGLRDLTGVEGYLADALTLQAVALHGVVQNKSAAFNVTPGDVTVTNRDNPIISDQLLSTSFLGYTGKVKYDRACHRATSAYTILNFVPSGEGSNGVPYVVETRGRVYLDPGNDMVQFIDGQGNMVNRSTIVFKDGTTKIPADRIPRYYYRSEYYIVCVCVCDVRVRACVCVWIVFFFKTIQWWHSCLWPLV